MLAESVILIFRVKKKIPQASTRIKAHVFEVGEELQLAH